MRRLIIVPATLVPLMNRSQSSAAAVENNERRMVLSNSFRLEQLFQTCSKSGEFSIYRSWQSEHVSEAEEGHVFQSYVRGSVFLFRQLLAADGQKHLLGRATTRDRVSYFNTWLANALYLGTFTKLMDLHGSVAATIVGGKEK